MARRRDTTHRVVGYLVADDGGPLTRGQKVRTCAGRRWRWRAALMRPIGNGGVVRLFASRAAAVSARNRAQKTGDISGGADVLEVRA